MKKVPENENIPKWILIQDQKFNSFENFRADTQFNFLKKYGIVILKKLQSKYENGSET